MSAPKLNEGPFANRYHLIRELGRGGMGSVDIAYQIDMQREVALKRILPENVGRAAAEAWFRREYRALAAIRHPGIPAVYDCGKCDDRVSYFTMEVIDGPSLAAALRTRTFEVVEAITIAIDLARILAVAHRVGVIHRDVKPANIILEAGGRVRLIDFGICAFLPRFRGRAALRSVGEHEYKTGPMEVAGSPGYTDPALFSGHPPSPQSDVFSVCVILYEMITGRRLFDERAGVFRQIDTGEFAPELATLVGELRRGSQLLPKDRQTSMDELVRGLEIARSAVVRAQAGGPAGASRWILQGLSGVSVIALISVGGYLMSGRAEPGPASAPVASATKATEPPAALDLAEAPAPAPIARPAAFEAPAAVVNQPETGRADTPPESAQTPAVLSPAARPQKLSQALVSEKADGAKRALGACLERPRRLNLEVVVNAGRARLTRVEWLPYDSSDETQNCLARALGAIKFPHGGSPGPYRLQIGE